MEGFTLFKDLWEVGDAPIMFVALYILGKWYLNSQEKLVSLFEQELEECKRDRTDLGEQLKKCHDERKEFMTRLQLLESRGN